MAVERFLGGVHFFNGPFGLKYISLWILFKEFLDGIAEEASAYYATNGVLYERRQK